MDLTFDARLFEWRGPAPHHWFALPEEACDHVAAQAGRASYGWGAIPVRVRIGATEWEMSLLPRGGGVRAAPEEGRAGGRAPGRGGRR